ncbi:MAG: hypothetical protein ACTH2Q_06035 [Propionibacteriaceae bacterium]
MTLANEATPGTVTTLAGTARPVPGRLVVGLTLATTAVALGIALRSPLAVTVLGLIAFGVLHNVLEFRYVIGRFASLLTGRFLTLLLLLITGIVGCRLLATFVPTVAGYAEIVLGYLVLAVGARIGIRGRWFAVASGVLAVTAFASLRWPEFHFVMLTHLHNVVPLVFLWDWARRITSTGARTAFRLSQVLWIVILPLVILSGLFDRLIAAGPGLVAKFVGDGSQVIAASAPTSVDATWGVRLLVVFAFMATMHYLVWVAFMPRFAPEESKAFEHRVPQLRGWRIWALGIVAGAFLAALFLSDYFQGKALYAALATYHAYLEFPILLALMMHGGRMPEAPSGEELWQADPRG